MKPEDGSEMSQKIFALKSLYQGWREVWEASILESPCIALLSAVKLACNTQGVCVVECLMQVVS